MRNLVFFNHMIHNLYHCEGSTIQLILLKYDSVLEESEDTLVILDGNDNTVLVQVVLDATFLREALFFDKTLFGYISNIRWNCWFLMVQQYWI